MKKFLLALILLASGFFCLCDESYGETAPSVADNPLLHRGPILFVTRQQYSNNHGTEANMCQTGEVNTKHFRCGSALKMLDVKKGRVTTILDSPKGVIRDPEVHFDAKKILFSMRKEISDDYHLYEIDVDGGNLKQLTFGSQVSDIQPIYLPDDRIVFSSTREPKYIPCQRHLMTNLYVINGDGSNVRQIGHNTQFEGRASLMPDGRILYTRWEYVDKHYSSAYGLWTVNPDGTNHALYFGNYAWQPGAIVDGRIIPGTNKFICIYTAVHELDFGAIVIGDRLRGLDGTEPILKIWPPDAIKRMSVWNELGRVGIRQFDSFKGMPQRYQNPFPLSEKAFLCIRKGPSGREAIYLLDTDGGETFVHAEKDRGVFDPMPIVSRQRPPVIPSRVDLSKDHGVFSIQDVYEGMFMERVKRGSVKRIRVVEAPPKLTYPPYGIGDWNAPGDGDAHHPVALNWNHYNNKRILGTAPVAEDGSAHFRVPAGRFVYFQLLDDRGRTIHSMRSGTMLQPGEKMGCVGCHEDHLQPNVNLPNRTPLALRRAPAVLKPWYGPPRKFSFDAEVQPVLDRNCVRCHDYDREGKGKELVLAGDKGLAFNMAYTNLMRASPALWTPIPEGADKPLISSVGCGPLKVLPPYSWGSTQSRLVDILLEGHYDVKLSPEELDRIITWIDLNIPYYPSHMTRYGLNQFGRSPLSRDDARRLQQIVAATPGGNAYQSSIATIGRIGSPVNFTRPHESLVLALFQKQVDPRRDEVLAIIQRGADNLKKHPRADMPAFVPYQADADRLRRHEQSREVEKRFRSAILKGERLYDRDVEKPTLP